MQLAQFPPSDRVSQPSSSRPSSQSVHSYGFPGSLRTHSSNALLSSGYGSSAVSLSKKGSQPSLRSNPSNDAAPQETIRPQHLNVSRPDDSPAGHRLAYKPSFTKPMFKWIRGELIGQGSYGRVFMALNATTGEVMAVKQVELPRIANDRFTRQLEVVQALQFESDTLRDLDHPNIVQYLGYEENVDTLSIFLEYVPGGSIASCLRNHGKFREEVTKSFTKQILNGLEYLHSKQILHRDMKADNILVEQSGTCKISDFGISKKAEAVNQGRAFTGMKGTVYWMAPEALDSQGKGYDVKVDIWSVGCIVQEMWTGLRPWSGEEVIAVMMKLVTHKQPPPLPSDMILSENACNFRNLCFQSDPRRRPSAALMQEHRYLVLPPEWTFKPSDLTKPSQPRSQSIRRHKSLLRRNNPPIDVDIPPIPDQGAAGPQSAYHDLNIATARPPRRPVLPPLAIPNLPSADIAPKPKVPRGPSPPIVIITPPGSPQKNISTDWLVRRPSPSTTESSENRSRTSRSSRSRRRRFRVTNPDCESDGEDADRMGNRSASRSQFVFNPPPLPEPTLVTPYSTQLAPGTSLQTNDTADLFSQAGCATLLASIGSNARTSSRSSSRPPSSFLSHKPREAKRSSDASVYSDSDAETDMGTSFWQKPPMDLTAPSRASSQAKSSVRTSSSSLRSSRSSKSSRNPWLSSRMSITEQGGSTWAPRPHVEDVVEHLEEFFPHHDLDQAVSEVGSRRPSLSNGRPITRKQNTKSIRRIAAEQVTRRQADPEVSRRRTRLWDSRLEEIKT